MTGHASVTAQEGLDTELDRITNGWSVPWLVELYPDDLDGRADLAADSSVLEAHGYVVAYEMVDDSQLLVTFGLAKAAPELADLDYAAAALNGRPPTLIRPYSGKRPEDATSAMAAEAAELATYGYVPVSQSWVAGNRGLAQIALGFLLAPVLILVPILLNRTMEDRAGALAVTYELQRDGWPVLGSGWISPAVPGATGTGLGRAPDAHASRPATWWRGLSGPQRLVIFTAVAATIVALALIVPYALIAAGVLR